MKLTFDHHVHTKYSNCCGEDYGLKEVVEKQHENDMEYVCVSDHIHAPSDTGGIADHHKTLAAFPDKLKTKPVYIGVELTFSTPEGDIPLNPESLPIRPAFAIGGCHYFPWDPDITMGNIPASLEKVSSMSSSEYEKLLNNHIHLLKKAVQNRHIDILAHPFDIFFRLGIFDERLLDMFHDIVLLCKTHNVAIEVNNASAKRCIDQQKKGTQFNKYCIEPKKFFKTLIQTAVSENVVLSPASDAHSVQNIGNFQDLLPFLLDEGINKRTQKETQNPAFLNFNDILNNK